MRDNAKTVLKIERREKVKPEVCIFFSISDSITTVDPLSLALGVRCSRVTISPQKLLSVLIYLVLIHFQLCQFSLKNSKIIIMEKKMKDSQNQMHLSKHAHSSSFETVFLAKCNDGYSRMQIINQNTNNNKTLTSHICYKTKLFIVQSIYLYHVQHFN